MFGIVASGLSQIQTKFYFKSRFDSFETENLFAKWLVELK